MARSAGDSHRASGRSQARKHDKPKQLSTPRSGGVERRISATTAVLFRVDAHEHAAVEPARPLVAVEDVDAHPDPQQARDARRRRLDAPAEPDRYFSWLRDQIRAWHIIARSRFIRSTDHDEAAEPDRYFAW